ncbi:hypothetical protein U1Q18_029481 [Sarracenia purpurea var. burkii]
MDLIEFVTSYEVKGGGEQRGFSLVLEGDGDFPAVDVSLVAGLSRGDLPADGGSEAEQEGGPRSSSPLCGELRRGGRSIMMLSATELGVGRGPLAGDLNDLWRTARLNLGYVERWKSALFAFLDIREISGS